MKIEIRKAGFVNKGAEMMLLSILDKIKERYPDATLVMAPTTEKGSQPFSRISRLGFRSKFYLRRGSIDLSWIGRFIPAKIRDAYGIVLDSEVDVVLDASGFSYSDQWGRYDCRELRDAVKKSLKYDQKFILMPQAFGPFEVKSNACNVKFAVNNSNLVFARDKTSFNYLSALFEEAPGDLRQVPDFTCELRPTIDAKVNEKSGMVAIIPNYRMLDKTGDESGKYMKMLELSIKTVLKAGLKPYFLIHETNLDKAIALELNSQLNMSPIEIVEEKDPKVLKGYIGVARFVVSSRYHATVSALSQAVPVVGTSWSHKYEELFSEYDFIIGLCKLDQLMSAEKLISELSDDEFHSSVVVKLEKNSQKVKGKVIDMWRELFEVVEG